MAERAGILPVTLAQSKQVQDLDGVRSPQPLSIPSPSHFSCPETIARASSFSSPLLPVHPYVTLALTVLHSSHGVESILSLTVCDLHSRQRLRHPSSPRRQLTCQRCRRSTKVLLSCSQRRELSQSRRTDPMIVQVSLYAGVPSRRDACLP